MDLLEQGQLPGFICFKVLGKKWLSFDCFLTSMKKRTFLVKLSNPSQTCSNGSTEGAYWLMILSIRPTRLLTYSDQLKERIKDKKN